MRPNRKLSSLLLIASLLGAPSLRCAAADFDEAPTPVKSSAPIYPTDMRRAGASGIVAVTVLIDENGDVAERTVAKSTRPEFEAAAVEAVGKWKFKPAKKAGVAVKSRVTIPIKFTMDS